ncbi:MAG: phage tail sheath C-terminal domain-containing protein [Oscillospiraceae bacterium]
MALGGGRWKTQQKALPGTYINFSSGGLAAPALSERGIVAVPLFLHWGEEGKVFFLSRETIGKDCKRLLGYPYGCPELLPIRELFGGAKKLLCYRVNKGAIKAKNTLATALWGGIRGNDIKTAIVAEPGGFFTVETYVEGILADSQRVSRREELGDNDWVSFHPEAILAASSGENLSGGTDGGAAGREEYDRFFLELCRHSFNILLCSSTEAEVKKQFMEWTKAMNEVFGANFQLVCYRPIGDSELLIGVENRALPPAAESDLVFWVAGAEAGCSEAASLTNRVYEGEIEVEDNLSQEELMGGIRGGKFLFHEVNGEVRVLEDVNTLKTFTLDKGEDFGQNQCIRLLHAIANDVALLFNTRYLGKIQNSVDGRIALWNDVCKILAAYAEGGGIDEFQVENVKILPGETKKKVVCIIEKLNIACAMTALYMNIIIE